MTGQVKTIIVTPTATPDPTLGQGAVSRSGISTGKVVGIVLGVALGIGLLIGIMVWYCVRRRHGGSSRASTPGFATSSDRDSTMDPSKNLPSRQVSQISSAGLLANKAPRIQTNLYGLGSGPRSPETSSTFAADRRSLGTDQRLNPYALFAHDEACHSNVSLQDNQDYSRQLRVSHQDPRCLCKVTDKVPQVANPDP